MFVIEKIVNFMPIYIMIFRINILKYSTIERTKFIVQNFPCIYTCCFDFENKARKLFHLYTNLTTRFHENFGDIYMPVHHTFIN